MRATVTCHSCGTVLGVPAGGVPAAGVTCNWCGAVTTAAPAPAAAAVTAAGPAAKPKAPPRQWADDEDDDGQPYDIPADEVTTKPCAGCGKPIALAAAVCVHCGHDHRGGKTAVRVFSPIDKTWEQGWPFARRLTVFAACQVVNALTMVVGIFGADNAGAAVTATLIYVLLQAFILGTYPRLRVRRNKKGQAEMTSTWRVCFVPLGPRKIDWRAHEGVSVGAYDGSGFTDWWIFITLLPVLVVPAVVWWWYAIQANRFFTALTLQSGAPETYLYRGLREAQAKEIAQTVTDATGLPLNTPL